MKNPCLINLKSGVSVEEVKMEKSRVVLYIGASLDGYIASKEV